MNATKRAFVTRSCTWASSSIDREAPLQGTVAVPDASHRPLQNVQSDGRRLTGFRGRPNAPESRGSALLCKNGGIPVPGGHPSRVARLSLGFAVPRGMLIAT